MSSELQAQPRLVSTELGEISFRPSSHLSEVETSATGVTAADADTARGRDLARRHRLEWMRAEAQRIQDALSCIRPQIVAWASIEQTRRLRPAEVQQLRTLRWESEQLHGEIRALYQEFTSLVTEGRARSR